MVKKNADRVFEVDGVKYINRILFGKQVLEEFNNQNRFVQSYIDNNRPWSTVTSDGEAFVGDTIQFKDGYSAKIVSIIQTGDTVDGYNVILEDIHNRANKSKIPLNGRASWECTIEKLEKS